MVAEENPEDPRQAREELRRLDKEFHADLFEVFEEGHAQFGDHLRGLLFELWGRARQRPPDADKRLEELEELAKKKDELRALVVREFQQQLPVLAEQFKSQIESITSSTFGFNMANALGASDLNLDMALSKKLYSMLNFDALDMYATDCNGYLQFNPTQPSGSSSSKLNLSELDLSELNIPELQSHDVDDELQQALQKRLRREGLLPSTTTTTPDNWVPLYINRETGRQAGLDFTTDDLISTQFVNTFLATTDNGMTWTFPNPNPPYDYGSCEDVELWVDDTPHANSACTWSSKGNAVESVTIPGTYAGSIVRARYRSVTRTLIP